jgi:hypothetical protein
MPTIVDLTFEEATSIRPVLNSTYGDDQAPLVGVETNAPYDGSGTSIVFTEAYGIVIFAVGEELPNGEFNPASIQLPVEQARALLTQALSLLPSNGSFEA